MLVNGVSTIEDKRRRGYRTVIEATVERELQRRGWLYLFEHRVGRYYVDFALPLFGVAVEVDGTYWHSRPRSAMRDAAKDSFLMAKGWRVLRIHEASIKDGSFVEAISAI